MKHWTRREAVGVLGAVTLGEMAPRWASSQTPSAGRPVIRAIAGDLDPASLRGPVLFHEHLSMRYPLDAPSHYTDDVSLMVDEARAAKADGLALIVDGGHDDMRRSLDALGRISRESGLHLGGERDAHDHEQQV